MTRIEIIKKVLALPREVVRGAVVGLNAPQDVVNSIDKMLHVNWLTDQIDKGLVSIDTVSNFAPVSAVKVDNSMIEATASTASRAESVALDAMSKANSALGTGKALSQRIDDLNDSLLKIAQNKSAEIGRAHV